MTARSVICRDFLENVASSGYVESGWPPCFFTLENTWVRYQNDTDQQSADRDDFDDAIDFVGWYTDKSNSAAGISKWDPYNKYLAYHEGQAGWKRGSYNQKSWLKAAAKSVDGRARAWSTQLQSCEEELNNHWWKTSA